jgi:hypothetical protein
MTRKVLAFIAILLGLSSLSGAQERTPAATPTLMPPYPFPYLFCPNVVAGKGATWQGITIGESTLDDVYVLMEALSDNYIIRERADESVLFDHKSYREAYENDIPSQTIFCTQDDVITAIEYKPGIALGNPPKLFLDDLVAKYGVPDAVTWANSSTSRVVFWFEEGIVASVTVTETYGSVFNVIYMPYQPVEGYESRWPFNQTRTEPLEHPEGGKQPPTEQNPFDFEAIAATLTAQPSPTVIATATP